METDYCGAPGMQTHEQALTAANNDESIQSIVLYIDSPGGTVSGTQNLATAIKNSKKPVVTFVNKMMASAAYWIGSSAQEIIADAETDGYDTLIGSIGTKCVVMDRSAEMASKGIKVHVISASKSTRKGKYMEDVMAGDYTRIKQDLDNINSVFHSGVRENRTGKLNSTKEDVFEGDVYDAKTSVKLGLIDRMGTFQQAVKRSLQLSKKQQLFNSNNNNMAFEKTLVASKATSFEVVDGGFLLSEDNLNSVEASLIAAEAKETQLNGEITGLTEQIGTKTIDIDAANQAKEANAARVIELEAEIVTLKTSAPGFVQTVKIGTDAIPGTKTPAEKYRTSFDDEADRLAKLRNT